MIRKCSVSGCWSRAKHKRVQMFGAAGLRAFGSATITFYECDKHWRKK